MQTGLMHHTKRVVQSWMISMLFASAASALNLGEIQVDSPLGQPFMAQIAVADLEEAGQLKARLASVNEYKRQGLQYPYGLRFHFRLREQAGKPAIIQISSSQAVNEPFIYLLVEVSTGLGTLLKTYAILLDPPAGPLPDAAPAEAPALPQTASAPDHQADHQADQAAQAAAKHKVYHRRAKRHPADAAKAAPSGAPAQTDANANKPAASLSISKSAPAASAASNSDALQEELIANAKQIEEMKLQIAELQAVIREQQAKASASAQHPDVADQTGGQPAHGAAGALASPPSPRPDEAVREDGVLAVDAPAPPTARNIGLKWFAPLLALIALLLAAGIWHRKRRPSRVMELGTTDDKPAAQMDVTLKMPAYGGGNREAQAVSLNFAGPRTVTDTRPQASPVADAMPERADIQSENSDRPFAEQSTDSQGWMSVPAEYALLIEANRFLRAGDEKSAEAILHRAIELNPGNINGYLALLKIYEQRNDSVRFAELAAKCKALGDRAGFADIAEMGRKLDPGNPLYS